MEMGTWQQRLSHTKPPQQTLPWCIRRKEKVGHSCDSMEQNRKRQPTLDSRTSGKWLLSDQISPWAKLATEHQGRFYLELWKAISEQLKWAYFLLDHWRSSTLICISRIKHYAIIDNTFWKFIWLVYTNASCFS